MKADSLTTKLRNVFNAKSSNGVALNDQIYAGPSLISRIFSRQHLMTETPEELRVIQDNFTKKYAKIRQRCNELLNDVNDLMTENNEVWTRHRRLIITNENIDHQLRASQLNARRASLELDATKEEKKRILRTNTMLKRRLNRMSHQHRQQIQQLQQPRQQQEREGDFMRVPQRNISNIQPI